MKATGVTRKIDELGRVVIPKEIRRNLGIRDGEPLEIYIENDGIFLKKHSTIQCFEDLSNKLCQIIGNIKEGTVIITDREKVVAVSNQKELINKKLSQDLIKLIDNRESLKSDSEIKMTFEDIEVVGYIDVVPIISSIDSLGLVIIESKDKENNSDIAKLVSKIISDKVDIY